MVRWLWCGGGVVTGHGSIWVVGCGLGINVDCVRCVVGISNPSLFFHSLILSLIYLSNSDFVSQIRFWFWFDFLLWVSVHLQIHGGGGGGCYGGGGDGFIVGL